MMLKEFSGYFSNLYISRSPSFDYLTIEQIIYKFKTLLIELKKKSWTLSYSKL